MPIERQSEQWPHRSAALFRAAGLLWDTPNHNPDEFFTGRGGTCTMCHRPRILPPGPFCSHGEGDEEFRRRMELDPNVPFDGDHAGHLHFGRRTAVDWSQPKHLHTPLHTPQSRPKHYVPHEFTNRHHFTPNDFNPPADSRARPSVRWKTTQPEQPTLNLNTPKYFDPLISTPGVADAIGDWGVNRLQDTHMYPVDRQPKKMYRLVNLDMSHPDMAPVHRALFGQDHPSLKQEEGLFPASDVPVKASPQRFNDKSLHQTILDHLNANPMRQGLGTHWTTDLDEARVFNTGQNGHTIPAVISANWYGRGEDPYRTDTGGNYPDEREITMMPGAPLQVTDMHLRHPAGSWYSVMGGAPQNHTAARLAFPMEDEDEEEEHDGSYCKDCGEGDSDWCEQCQTCDHCDPDHEKHCPKCGPDDVDWCKDCEECKLHDDHEDHCPHCGPGDSDWCKSCEQCQSCDYHDNHCPSCGPGDSDWCDNCEECKYCGYCDCSPEVDAEPISLKSPLFDHRNRPSFYNNSEGRHENLFLPHDFNPASEATSRPYMDFPAPEDEDPTLDFGHPLYHDNGVDRIHAGSPGAKIYRGVHVDLGHPMLHELRRAIFGPNNESYYRGTPNSVWKPPRSRWESSPYTGHQPGMIPGPYSDRELAAPPADPDQLHRHLHPLLDFMGGHYGKGIGKHWSTDFQQAKNFSGAVGGLTYRDRVPVMLKGRWHGQGENPYRHDTGEESAGQFEEEKEMNLLHGAPVTLTDVMIHHPVTKEWHSLMNTPERRYARRQR